MATVVAVGYLVAILLNDGTGEHLWQAVVALFLPLALIYFPEELGNFTGYVGRGGNIQTKTPPFLLSFMGWLMLTGIPLFTYFMSR